MQLSNSQHPEIVGAYEQFIPLIGPALDFVGDIFGGSKKPPAPPPPPPIPWTPIIIGGGLFMGLILVVTLKK